MERHILVALALTLNGACIGEQAIGTQGDALADTSDTPDDAAPDDTTPDDTSPEDTSPDDTSPDDTSPVDVRPDLEDTGDTGACAPVVYPATPSTVLTSEGPVAGAVDDGVTRWLGIPYAAPPIGPLRFRQPAPPPCRSEVLAPLLAQPCPQRAGGALVGDEDCLTLNIWAPSNAQSAPVLVFFHGGGHIQGSAVETLIGGGLLYDGQHLARTQGVVVVTVQYRLGALGWLVHPALSAEDDSGPIGNRGLLDQQAALRWLSAHLELFGGDPSRVTIFGESAGAVDTSLHVAMPSSAGLFSAAIVQSGSPVARPLDTALNQGMDAVAQSPCGAAPDIAVCLRGLTTEALLTALPGQIGIGSPGIGMGGGNFGPVLDGRLIPAAPLSLLRTPRDNAPTVIVGSNTEEMAELFVQQVSTEAAYLQALRVGIAAPIAFVAGETTDEVLAAILAVYPLSAYASPQLAIEDVYTDLRFTCPGVELLRALEAGGHPTRRYLFARRLVTANGERPASHGIELPFVFGSWRNIPLYQPAPADRLLSDQMMSAWATLGTTIPELGDGWPEWSAELGRTLILDGPLALANAPREDRCAFWRSFTSP